MVSLSKYLGYSQSHECGVHYSTGRVGWLSALFVHSGEVVTVLCAWLVMKTVYRNEANTELRFSTNLPRSRLSTVYFSIALGRLSLLADSDVSFHDDGFHPGTGICGTSTSSFSQQNFTFASHSYCKQHYLLTTNRFTQQKRNPLFFISRSRCMLQQWLLQVLIPCQFRFGCKDLKDRCSYQHEQSSSY